MNLLKKLRNKKSPVNHACLQLEALERRDVPTVVFNAHFGPETVQGSNVGMQNPPVYLVFSGSYWNTTQGKADESTMLSSAKNILGPTYLSGLIQYGSDGHATFAGNWNDLGTVPSQPSAAALQNFLQNSITSHNAAPGFNDLQHAPLYVVISDPTSSASYSGGWNAGGTYKQSFGFITLPENMHMVWVGTRMNGTAIDRDAYTQTLSHEVAETISDPSSNAITVTAPAGLPASLKGDNQIGDNEPAAAYQYHYGYRLNGDLVQAYWSRADNAYIVPDGNRQKFYLDPIWSGSTFSGTYNLSVQGDQLGVNYNDFVRLDTTNNANTSKPETRATMNNETAQFDQNVINQLSVNTGGGSNGVRVNAVLPGVTVNINSGGASNDLVFVGSESESLSAIKGTVNVANTSGRTQLIVDGAADGAHNVAVTDHSVSFDGLTTINYTGNQTSLSQHNVTKLDIYDGKGSKLVRVDSKPAFTDVTIYGSTLDWVYGNAAALVTILRTHA